MVFGGMYALLHLIRWNQRRQIGEVAKMEDKMRKLELTGIKNQLDPHFTFNALNVLTYLSSNKDSEGVEKFARHFSKLLRKQLENSDKPRTHLRDELEFVQHYIELQKLRHEVPIDLQIIEKGSVNNQMFIPKMMIHTHVDNAIKHGLLPNKGGEIFVRIIQDDKKTVFEIENNEAYREQSVPSKQSINLSSTGRGLDILSQLYDLYFQLFDVKIHQEIIELKDDEGLGIGTLVRIRM